MKNASKIVIAVIFWLSSNISFAGVYREDRLLKHQEELKIEKENLNNDLNSLQHTRHSNHRQIKVLKRKIEQDRQKVYQLEESIRHDIIVKY